MALVTPKAHVRGLYIYGIIFNGCKIRHITTELRFEPVIHLLYSCFPLVIPLLYTCYTSVIVPLYSCYTALIQDQLLAYICVYLYNNTYHLVQKVHASSGTFTVDVGYIRELN